MGDPGDLSNPAGNEDPSLKLQGREGDVLFCIDMKVFLRILKVEVPNVQEAVGRIA